MSGPGGSSYYYTITPGTKTKFNLTCNVGTGYSTPVVWSKDGSTSLPSSAMASGNVLIFTNPQPADSGKYTCSFLGSNGPASEAFVVSIEGELVEVCVCFMSGCVGVSDSVPADDQCKCIYMMRSSSSPSPSSSYPYRCRYYSGHYHSGGGRGCGPLPPHPRYICVGLLLLLLSQSIGTSQQQQRYVPPQGHISEGTAGVYGSDSVL